MATSRRDFLRTLGIGTAAGAALQFPLAGVSAASTGIFEPARTSQASGPILLNSNENVYGPSKKVAAALLPPLARANRYPFLETDQLQEQIAAFHHVKPDQVLLGCGSSDILRVTASTFLGNGRQMVQATPTFEALAFNAQATGAEVVSVPLAHNFAHDLDGMLGRVGNSTTLVHICNPNNPTGSITPRRDIETFISKLPATCYALIDEAYHHYAGQSSMYASFLDHPIDDERVVVARTFSKVYGMAGLRLGYAVGSLATIKRMGVQAAFDNLNIIVIPAAMAALEDQASVTDFVKRNADDRQEFFNQAMARMLKPIDSHTNFVMMDTHHPVDETIEHFRKNNILIGRKFPAMPTHVRISLGTPSQMRAFWRTWDTLPFANSMKHGA